MNKHRQDTFPSQERCYSLAEYTSGVYSYLFPNSFTYDTDYSLRGVRTFHFMLYECMEHPNKNQAQPAREINRPMHTGSSLQKRVCHTITSASLLQEKASVIIGVSGGSDSIFLLHILSHLFPDSKRVAVYIDHGLRPEESKAEKILVQKQAEICSAHFETIAIEVQKEKNLKKCSLEEAARNLRYQALESVRVKFQAVAIAVGHTADDQAEEILLRLIRGSGSRGLSGMSLQRGNIIRPLLQERKEALISWLLERNIPYCHDSSNDDTKFLRNKIRLDLLPTLEQEYNRSMRQTLLQTAEILDEEDKFLSVLTDECFSQLTQKNRERITLELPDFQQKPLAIQRRILEKICWSLQSKPSFKKIHSLLELASSRSAKEIHLADGVRAVRQNQTILFHRPSLEKAYRGPGIIPKTFQPVTIPCAGTYHLADLDHRLEIKEVLYSPELPMNAKHQLLDMKKITFPLLLRQHQPGERFHPFGAPGRKKISKFLSDQKIPLSARDRFPLLLSEESILAIVGLRIDQQFRITGATQHALLVKWAKNE